MIHRVPSSIWNAEEPHVEEEARILARILLRLCRVYDVDRRGNFDWCKWDAEDAAQRTARFLVNGRLDWWDPFVYRSRHSRFAGRVLELLEAEVAGRMRFQVIYGVIEGRSRWADMSWPGSEKLEWRQLADWIVAKVRANDLRKPLKRGPDPGRLVWRNVCLAQAVGEIVQVGFRPATSNARISSACQVAADLVGLSYATVLKLWMTPGIWRGPEKTPRP